MASYVPTSLFHSLADKLKKPERIAKAIFITGAKGVGKSSLVKALYDHVLSNAKEYEVNATEVYYFITADNIICESYSYGNIFKKMRRSDKKGYLFIDNIQCMPSSDENALPLRCILKDQIHINPKWQVVVASSRHGLSTLITNNVLSDDEFTTNLYILNPEESVTKKIFEDKIHKDKIKVENPEDYKNDLGYLGHVPGFVLDFANVGCDMKKFKPIYEMTTRSILNKDAAYYDKVDADLYCKILAIISAGKDVPLAPFGLALPSLPWSFLRLEIKNNVYYVCAVCPYIQEVATKFICSDPVRLVQRIKAVKDIMGGKLGNLSGQFFEELICSKICLTKSLAYIYYDDQTGEVKEEMLEISDINEFLASKKRRISETCGTSESSITHSPHAVDFDFVIKQSGETHGLQVTIQGWKKKCGGSKFYENKTVTHKYLLTTELACIESVTEACNGDTALSNAFHKFHLRIVNPLSVLSDEQLALMRG